MHIQEKKQEIKYSSSEKCDRCNGQGSEPGSSPSECSMCGGHGKVRSNQGFFTVQQTCPQCGGEVKKFLILVKIARV